jgi:hypothetical protein
MYIKSHARHLGNVAVTFELPLECCIIFLIYLWLVNLLFQEYV